MFVNCRGYAYASGGRQTLQACGKVNARTIKVATQRDHVTEVYADAQLDLAPIGPIRGPRRHRFLDFHGALDRFDDASEFHERAVAHKLESAAAILGNEWLDDRAPHVLQGRQRAGFIVAHEAAVTHHVNRHDGR
jgi:hypothetical protein